MEVNEMTQELKKLIDREVERALDEQREYPDWEEMFDELLGDLQSALEDAAKDLENVKKREFEISQVQAEAYVQALTFAIEQGELIKERERRTSYE